MGILLTKVDRRTNFAKDISAQIREAYGNRVHIFENCVPLSVKAAETTAEGKSIYGKHRTSNLQDVIDRVQEWDRNAYRHRKIFPEWEVGAGGNNENVAESKRIFG